MNPTTKSGTMEPFNMILKPYDSLDSLDISNYDWNCRVRAQSVWKGINRETKEVYGINIIFLDDSNSRIHAYLNTKLSALFEKDILEGHIYVLSNFKVKQYLGDETNRAIRNEKHIYFTEHTKLIKDNQEGLPIDDYGFDFSAIEETEKIADDNRFLIDVVGIVQNRRPIMITVKDGNEIKRLRFDLSNGRDTLKVTFFNELAVNCEKALIEMNNWPQILAVASGKVGRFNGKIFISNYPATRFYLNPNHYAVKQVMTRYEKLSVLNISSPEEEEKIYDFLTVKEITELTGEYMEKQVCCEVTLKRVDEKAGWFYKKCTRCMDEVIKENARYKCAKCKRVIPYPDLRFRVFTICGDNTGSIAIIIPDSEIRRIIGKAVLDVLGDNDEDLDVVPLPNELKELKNKSYTVTIALCKDNIKNGSTVYNATHLVNGKEIIGNHSPQRTKLTETDQMSIVNESCAEDLMKGTPTTAKSTTKVRPRQIPTVVLYEDEGNLNEPVLKNVKKEH